MSCKGCGDKPSRYALPGGDVDHQPQAGAGFAPSGPPDPLMEFVASKNVSYEEFVERQRFHQRLMEQQHNQMLVEMTDAMRRKYIDELVGVANADKIGAPGLSPDQAVVALKEVLDRPEFSFISDIYPNLRPAVASRYEEIKARALPLN